MATTVTFTKQLAAASSNNICASQSGSAGTALTLNGSAVSGGVATIDNATAANVAIGRRVVLAYTGTDTSFTIVGTNGTGNAITDTGVGSSGSAQSNLDFVTVTSITPVGGGLTGVTAGTNGVASSPWVTWDWRGKSPFSLGMAVELVSGAVNFTIQHTYDDPNNLPAGVGYPLAFSSPVINGASATVDGAYATPVVATRVLINSGTGEIRVRFVQGGVG